MRLSDQLAGQGAVGVCQQICPLFHAAIFMVDGVFTSSCAGLSQTVPTGSHLLVSRPFHRAISLLTIWALNSGLYDGIRSLRCPSVIKKLKVVGRTCVVIEGAVLLAREHPGDDMTSKQVHDHKQ